MLPLFLILEWKESIKYVKGDILSKHDHVIFVLDEGMELRYNDVRKFGRMKLVDHDDYKNQLPLSKLGPEPFEIDYLELYQKLKRKIKRLKQFF